ncbi:MAG: hypothetical protein A2X35_10125 [Elusimicrobia bacterium GWA2_61_42]|nr:MAG: hypothetical protein A2X35_10125 [Elusimicrobia bacterium GWA2_61_42]OGR76668.1 MAG: hypothetical protein A2X38_03775 [Elusimicrobia bacterium GWC2_61_25]
MKSLAVFFLLNLAAAAGAQQVKYAPADGALAVPLSTDNSYFRSPAHPAYDYWNLSSFYAAQKNDYSCTSASAAMALNALLNSRRQRGDQDENITEDALTEKISKLKWKELTSEAGLDGRHGLTLAQLAAGLKEAAAAYGAAGAAVTAVEVSSRTGLALENFRKALSSNERDPRDVMLLHFAQDALTGAPGGPSPHVSPVGAYDEKTRRVLVLDVDRRWYEPYWAADVQVFKAMAVKTKNFGHGGYAVIKAAR